MRLFLTQLSTLHPPLFRELRFCGSLLAAVQGAARRYNRYNAILAMIPLIPEDMLVTTVQTMCYFCTAVGLLLTFIFAPRR